VSLRLLARARQFSSFVLMVGKIASATEFEPTAAMIVRDKDDLEIPLMLETMPTPKVLCCLCGGLLSLLSLSLLLSLSFVFVIVFAFVFVFVVVVVFVVVFVIVVVVVFVFAFVFVSVFVFVFVFVFCLCLLSLSFVFVFCLCLCLALSCNHADTPKEFKDAIESLSPEQQRFCKA
jgi:hypothetical protein